MEKLRLPCSDPAGCCSFLPLSFAAGRFSPHFFVYFADILLGSQLFILQVDTSLIKKRLKFLVTPRETLFRDYDRPVLIALADQDIEISGIF